LLDDAIAIAATFVCICRMLYRLRYNNQRWRTYPVFLLNENRWRAQRYGMEKGLIDFGKGEIIPFDNLLEELVVLIAEDVEYFNCQQEVRHCLEIYQRGTSADRQLEAYHASMEAEDDHNSALIQIVDQLIKETCIGTSG